MSLLLPGYRVHKKDIKQEKGAESCGRIYLKMIEDLQA